MFAGVQHYNEIKGISICEFLPPHLSIYVDQPAEEVQKKLKQSGQVASRPPAMNTCTPTLRSPHHFEEATVFHHQSEAPSRLAAADGAQKMSPQRMFR